jgi:hypothetical protein
MILSLITIIIQILLFFSQRKKIVEKRQLNETSITKKTKEYNLIFYQKEDQNIGYFKSENPFESIENLLKPNWKILESLTLNELNLDKEISSRLQKYIKKTKIINPNRFIDEFQNIATGKIYRKKS